MFSMALGLLVKHRVSYSHNNRKLQNWIILQIIIFETNLIYNSFIQKVIILLTVKHYLLSFQLLTPFIKSSLHRIFSRISRNNACSQFTINYIKTSLRSILKCHLSFYHNNLTLQYWTLYRIIRFEIHPISQQLVL